MIYLADKIIFHLIADVELLKDLAGDHLKVVVRSLNLPNIHLLELKH